MGKAGLLRHLQNLQRKRPRQSVALQKSRRTGFHALEGRALSRPQRVLQVPLLINFNKPTLIVNRRSETFFFESLCFGLPRRLVRRSVFAKVEAVSAKAGALLPITSIFSIRNTRKQRKVSLTGFPTASLRRGEIPGFIGLRGLGVIAKNSTIGFRPSFLQGF